MDCKVCKTKGHFARNCPDRRTNRDERKQATYTTTTNVIAELKTIAKKQPI